MANPAPGFLRYPDYDLTIEPARARIQVTAGGMLIAETDAPVQVREGRYEPVWYLPFAAVDGSVLERSTTRTHCPFKGDASYWNLHTPDGVIADAMWAYESPFDESRQLAGYVAFYSDRVTIRAQRVADG